LHFDELQQNKTRALRGVKVAKHSVSMDPKTGRQAVPRVAKLRQAAPAAVGGLTPLQLEQALAMLKQMQSKAKP